MHETMVIILRLLFVGVPVLLVVISIFIMRDADKKALQIHQRIDTMIEIRERTDIERRVDRVNTRYRLDDIEDYLTGPMSLGPEVLRRIRDLETRQAMNDQYIPIAAMQNIDTKIQHLQDDASKRESALAEAIEDIEKAQDEFTGTVQALGQMDQELSERLKDLATRNQREHMAMSEPLEKFLVDLQDIRKAVETLPQEVVSAIDWSELDQRWATFRADLDAVMAEVNALKDAPVATIEDADVLIPKAIREKLETMQQYTDANVRVIRKHNDEIRYLMSEVKGIKADMPNRDETETVVMNDQRRHPVNGADEVIGGLIRVGNSPDESTIDSGDDSTV